MNFAYSTRNVHARTRGSVERVLCAICAGAKARKKTKFCFPKVLRPRLLTNVHVSAGKCPMKRAEMSDHIRSPAWKGLSFAKVRPGFQEKTR